MMSEEGGLPPIVATVVRQLDQLVPGSTNGRDEETPSRAAWRARLRQRALAPRPGPIILLYHQVAELEHDRWSLAVSPRNFAEQLDVLARRRLPVSLRQVTADLRQRSLDRQQVAITFDDGYLDNLTEAKPILERFGIPATVFVVSGAVGRDREFWWDELDRLLLGEEELPVRLTLRIGDRDHQWTIRGGQPVSGILGRREVSRGRLHRTLWRRFRSLSDDERWQALERLRAWAGQPEAVRDDRRAMSAAQLRKLAAGGLIEIGAHTMTHSRLSALAPEDQYAEIRESKTRLEEIIGAPVTNFSYPFGGRLDVSASTVDAVERAGFASACTTREGAVRRATNPFRLPRLYVGNWPGDEFEQRLAPWF
jgi:peptidoglycan/xylan/chitin deacetylase (PgdA/CDA1 family)